VAAVVGGAATTLRVYALRSKKFPVEKVSSASMVKEELPAVMGVPEITPDEAPRESPEGRDPEKREKLTVP
jgi:hypothetical protein